MNAPVDALIVIAPLLVDAGAENVNGSLSASVADTDPLTTPVDAFGAPTVAFAPAGALLAGLIVTDTAWVATAPRESVTVTVTVSLFAAAAAPVLAAACRATAVGV